MIAAACLMHFFWSLKLGTIIIFNFLDALDEILWEDYRLNNYS